jgi:hypothetical protein
MPGGLIKLTALGIQTCPVSYRTITNIDGKYDTLCSDCVAKHRTPKAFAYYGLLPITGYTYPELNEYYYNAECFCGHRFTTVFV